MTSFISSLIKIIVPTIMAVLGVADYVADGRLDNEITLDEFMLAVSNTKDRYYAWIAWQYACTATSYSCEGVDSPVVVSKPLPYGLYGMYLGGPEIFIQLQSRGLHGWQRRAAILHETIHYLQWKVGGLPIPGPTDLICKAEEEAFFYSDTWLRQKGQARLMRGKNWWKPYRHCRQYYQ